MKAIPRLTIIVILAGLLLALFPAYGAAAGSHLGIKPSQIVCLTAIPLSPSPSDNWVLKRLLPNGTLETDEFVVPKGQVLIITDIEYPNPSSVGALLTTNTAGTYFYNLGTVAFKEHFTAGFVVPAETALKIVVPTLAFLQLTVVGYLAPSK